MTRHLRIYFFWSHSFLSCSHDFRGWHRAYVSTSAKTEGGGKSSSCLPPQVADSTFDVNISHISPIHSHIPLATSRLEEIASRLEAIAIKFISLIHPLIDASRTGHQLMLIKVRVEDCTVCYMAKHVASKHCSRSIFPCRFVCEHGQGK